MFSESLLECSPSRAPLLEKRHCLYAAACGAAALLAWLGVLGRLYASSSVPAIAVQSGFIGTAAAVFALTLCYVYAESRRLALHTVFWVGLVCLLNVPGFVCFLVYTAVKTGNWKRAAVPCAYAVEVLLVGALALAPLIYTEALPKTVWREVLETLVPPPPPPPPSPPGSQSVRRAAHRLKPAEPWMIPPVIPPTIALVREEPLPPAQFQSSSIGVPGGAGNGLPGGALDSVLGSILRNAETQPPPPTTTRPAPPRLLRIGGSVSAARVIYQPKPDYPELARLARIEGEVELEAVIGADGTVEELKVRRGHPLLVKAAIDAVRKWRYQPTLLNGEPVEVMTEITVTFKMTD